MNTPALAACTVASRSKLALVRVLAASFAEHHPSVPFFVLLVDEVTPELRVGDAEGLRIEDVTELNAATLRFRYSEQELTYAMTPFLLAALLRRGFESAVYLKQESLVIAPLAPALELVARHSIVLTPHLLAPLAGGDADARELNILRSGAYNVGFVGVRRSPEGSRFLEWWSERLQTHCVWDVENGLHFEQRWLDLVPGYFADVGFVRDPGFNVAHWNLPERRVTQRGDTFYVGDKLCRFVRFSGFDRKRPGILTRYNDRLDAEDLGDLGVLLRRYVAALDDAGHARFDELRYAYDHFDNGVRISSEARRWYRELDSSASEFGNPFEARAPNSYFRWQRRRAIRAALRRAAGLPRRLARRLKGRLQRWLAPPSRFS